VLAAENDLTQWDFNTISPLTTAGTDDVQTMTVTATSGSYELVFDGATTSALAYDAPLNAGTGNIQSALTALASIGTGNVVVSGTVAAPVITFEGTLADQPVQLISVQNDPITSENAVNTIVQTTPGAISDKGDNSPTPTGGLLGSTVGGVYEGVGTLNGLGMVLPYNPSDSATGLTGTGSVNADDITATAGLLNTSFSENLWRVRGGLTATSGGAPANGWSALVPEYTQGMELMVPTTGYSDVYVTLDWDCSTSGILDAQPQYTVSGNSLNVTGESLTTANSTNSGLATLTYTSTGFTPTVGDSITVSGLGSTFNGTVTVLGEPYAPNPTATSFSYVDNVVPAGDIAGNTYNSSIAATNGAYDPIWSNAGPQVQAVSGDYYGATLTGAPIPLVIDASNIAAANNNPISVCGWFRRTTTFSPIPKRSRSAIRAATSCNSAAKPPPASHTPATTPRKPPTFSRPWAPCRASVRQTSASAIIMRVVSRSPSPTRWTTPCSRLWFPPMAPIRLP